MEDIKPEFKKKDIRSYVIRGGRITAGQKKAFDSHWNDYGLSLFDGPMVAEDVFGRTAPLVVEIGFGMGDSLLQMAQQETDKNFIGIEVHPPGVGHLLANCAKQKVNNLRIYMADAVDVLDDCIAAGSVDRVQIYFPDPWHKKRHHKRRVVTGEFVDLLEATLEPGGEFRFLTDVESYAGEVIELMEGRERFENLYGPGEAAPARVEGFPLTHREAWHEEQGDPIWRFVWCYRPPEAP